MRVHIRPASLLALACLATIGCRKDEPVSSEAPASAARRPHTTPQRTTRVTPERMRDHFTAVGLVRDALIAGNLDLAQWNATWLAEREPDPGIASWSPSVGQLRQHATRVAAATDLAAAATASAELALECGRCHQANRVSPTFASDDRRMAASGRRPHMLEHQWATERMWEGLIGPSESRWAAGTGELATAPLGQDEIFADASATPAIAKLATDVHALAAEGSKAEAWSERGAIYGRLLATCAACHAAIPAPSR